MEEENQVLGLNAGAVENKENLESEDFVFYCQNKKEAKNNIDSSSKTLDDFIDSLIQDVPAPEEDEVKSGIDGILGKVYSEEEHTQTVKDNGKKRIALKVLFVAALLSALSFSGLFALGNRHEISIENGFVAFAKDTARIVFFGEGEKYISIDSLFLDLENHGYEDILFPQEFINRSDDCKVSVPEYIGDEVLNQATFELKFKDVVYKFGIHKNNDLKATKGLVDMGDAETVVVNGISMNVVELNDETTIEFINDGYSYYITSTNSYSDMLKIAESIQ